MDQLSGIQNLAWCNKNHSFCEVVNGQTTRFLEDAWKQEPNGKSGQGGATIGNDSTR